MRRTSLPYQRRIEDGLEHLVYVPRVFRLVWVATGAWGILWAMLLMLQGVLPAVVVYLTRPLVDSVARIVGGTGEVEVRAFLLFAGLMGGALLLSEILNNALLWVRAYQARILRDHISSLIQVKSQAIDLAYYESSDFHDHLQRAREQAGNNALVLLDSTGNLLKNSVSMLGIALVIVPYGWWLPFVLVLSSLPALLTLVRHQWRMQQWWLETTSERRWADYYDWIITAGDAAPEQRIFGWGRSFHEAFLEIRKRLRDGEMGLIKNEILARILSSAIGLLIFGAVLGWMVWRATKGYATLGDLALFYQAFNQGHRLMRAALDDTGQIFAKMLFIRSLFEFLELEPQITSPSAPQAAPVQLREEIRFKNVTFRYPNTERAALRNFNLSINAGATVAIVGSNGAGKSTLVKLLCRFYDPEAGSIEIDGVDLRDMDLAALRRLVTVMFQTPMPYHATVADNIAIGDLSAPPARDRVETAARSAGAREFIDTLPQGYDTLLGKTFVDGTELSGGERQRIALARAFYRQAPVVVLDEPTSFMDSWAEAEWLDRFEDLVRGRTAIIITHRFTTAMRADCIYVVDQGRIVESGSHKELMALEGRYARSWIAQTRSVQRQVGATDVLTVREQKPDDHR